MLFNSHVFLFVFLPLVLLLWYRRALPLSWRLAMLTLASYLFYAWWDWRFVSLMLVSTLVDFLAGQRIHAATESSARRGWLVVSLAANLGLLAFFKYAGFFSHSLSELVQLFGAPGFEHIPEIILPIGISFYTFQSMSYSIDIYRRDAKPTRDFLRFAAYVSMFPQLVAGPIVRYSEIEQQLDEVEPPPSPLQAAVGARLFVLGLAKKLLIADVVARRVDPLLADTAALDLVTGWLAMLGYTTQIYFDFSGYSDMAVGLGLLLGFRFPQNFNSPYKSADISQFWRRWHMSLSFWLRDYLYISMGGGRRGRGRTLRNLVITMFLGGLWHGAAWTFVVWGLYHGLLLVLNILWRQRGVQMPKFAAIALTFLSVVVGWVFFRAATFADAGAIFSAMLGLGGAGLAGIAEHAVSIALVCGALGISLLAPNTWEIPWRPRRLEAALVGMILLLCILRLSSPSPFLYFQF